jgi:biopolymer transport protein TolR
MQSGGSNGSGAAAAAATYRTLRSRHVSTAMGEINVTPLVDVVLVLLLVFMVTAPMMTRGIDVTLPVADQPRNPQEDRLITVTLNPQGRIYIGDKPVALPLLEDEVRGRLQVLENKVAYLRADEGLRYGAIITVMDIMKKAGVEQVGLAYVSPQERAQERRTR